ncbi:hypothetical protein V5N11_022334 [Cardamine amara subsp. amara]|uniref:Uncharacterized protein n=1 Tax=Cardamine amara subsp. amara TaxID=228776 RepID=A0ABD1ACF9_CARAN
MARISLLFSLALVLAIGSVLAHPPSHKKTPKTLCPPTLSKLQTFPFIEISKYLEKKAQSAPDTIQFKALFAICKGYNDYIGALAFTSSKKVSGSVHTKFALMTKALFAAQAHVGVDGVLAVKLSKSYSAMAEGYVKLVQKIAVISAKAKFNANAQISVSDRAAIQKCVMKLKVAIRVYVNVISQCSKTFSVEKKIGAGGFIGAGVNHGLGLGGKLIGLGGKGQVGAGVLVGGKLGAKGGVHVGGKVGGHVGAKIGAQGKAKGGVHVGAKAGGNVGGFFGGFLGFDAAGKAKVGGGKGFRPLSHPREKHFN